MDVYYILIQLHINQAFLLYQDAGGGYLDKSTQLWEEAKRWCDAW